MAAKKEWRVKGEEILRFRKEKGYSRLDVYDETKVHPETLRHLEESASNPTVGTIVPVARWMGKTIEELLEEIEINSYLPAA